MSKTFFLFFQLDGKAAVRRRSFDLPGGSVQTGGGEILLRTKGQAYRGADFEGILLRQPQLAEAKSTLAAAQADLEKANLDLERTQIKAPFDGRVRAADQG